MAGSSGTMLFCYLEEKWVPRFVNCGQLEGGHGLAVMLGAMKIASSYVSIHTYKGITRQRQELERRLEGHKQRYTEDEEAWRGCAAEIMEPLGDAQKFEGDTRQGTSASSPPKFPLSAEIGFAMQTTYLEQLGERRREQEQH